MVGLVIVSHSNALAQAAADLVRQVSTRGIPIAAVGGVGADRMAFGTNAVDIVEAIESVYSSDGVLVLVDLGSAILSAETALDLLPDTMKPGILICEAALVEGAVAAGVQISSGGDLETVRREAAQALIPKIRHLAGSEAISTETPASEPVRLQPVDRQEILLTVNTRHGLHARPAARFIQTASAFAARIRVKKQGSPRDPVSATSLNSLATLGINRGDRIVVSAAGADARNALEALARLVNEDLQIYDQDTAAVPETTATKADDGQGLAAVALAEGIALGPLFHYRTPAPEIPRHRCVNPDREWEDLLRAMDKTGEAIRQRRQTLESALGNVRAAIFDAHLLILKDPALLDRTRRRVFKNNENAARAWQQSVQEIANTYRELDDDYVQQRAADVVDVGGQVLLELLGQDAATLRQLPQPSILVAGELTPTDTAMLDPQRVLGIATVAGGPTSHGAILARAIGLPAIAGIDPAVLKLAENTPLALDGFSGTLWIRPPAKIAEHLNERRRRWLQQRDRLRKVGRRPAVTRDGRRVAVAANLGSVIEAGKAIENGADGVGLLRTEFLYLQRSRPPSEAEQTDALVRIARAIGDKPICVRTLDVGGDKPLAYLRVPVESNPYLGLRAARLSLRYPEIFHSQLRAILRAGAGSDFRLMFPMITRTEEVDRLLAMRDAAHRELSDENVKHRWPIPTGIMIETPAAALLIASLVKRLDFVSIGTNDLTQYTLAAERGNAELADYADALHPVILQLIRQVVDETHRQGKSVAVCGELAADPVAVPVLVGLGVDEISLAPPAIPGAKAVIRKLAQPMADELAKKILAADNAGSARRLAADFFQKLV